MQPSSQQQLVLLRRRLRLIIRRLIIRLSLRSPSGGPHGLHTEGGKRGQTRLSALTYFAYTLVR